MAAVGMFLSSIRIDGSTQARLSINDEVVAEYAQAISDGVAMPPIVAFFDGVDYWLGDGFHRVHGHRNAGRESILADIRTGTRDDARLYAAGANDAHGLRRTAADKRKAIEIVLELPMCAQWGDREIARHCKVSHPLVANVRRSLETITSDNSGERAFVDKHGNLGTMKTAGINAGRPKSTATLAKEQAEAEADQRAEDGAEDPLKLLDDAQRQNTELLERIAALSSDDTKAELDKQVRARKTIEGRLSDEMETVKRQDKVLRKFGVYFEELRKITGAEKNAEVIELVRAAFKRAA